MSIFFIKHNVTTDFYIQYSAKTEKVFVFHQKRSLTPVPEGVDKIDIVYKPHFVGRIFFLLNFDRDLPQYISKLSSELRYRLKEDSSVVTFDFYDFIHSQLIRFKKKNPNTKLYVWSETRQWPSFWLSRWVMYGFWWYFKKNIQYVEKVFVFSEEGERFFRKNAPEIAVEIMPAPIDIGLFYPEANRLYMPEQKLRIIMNARYIQLKEHRTFFDSLLLLKKRQVPFSVSLIGRGGHLQSELEEYAQELGINENISWLNPVPIEELREIYNAHDVLVLASNREAIGMVVPEAMACGLATVTSQAVGANTYVEEEKTGLIFETGNAGALADALEKLSEKGLAESYGKAGARVIREKYSVDVLGRKLLTALE